MLAMGAPQEAASAELSWAILGADGTPVAQFQAQGVQAAPGVWRFTLPEGVTEWEQERQEALQQNSWPQGEFVYVLQVFNRDGALLSEHGSP